MKTARQRRGFTRNYARILPRQKPELQMQSRQNPRNLGGGGVNLKKILGWMLVMPAILILVVAIACFVVFIIPTMFQVLIPAGVAGLVILALYYGIHLLTE